MESSSAPSGPSAEGSPRQERMPATEEQGACSIGDTGGLDVPQLPRTGAVDLVADHHTVPRWRQRPGRFEGR